MKTNHYTRFITAVSLVALTTAGCAKEKPAEATLPTAQAVASSSSNGISVSEPAVTLQPAATVIPDMVSANWSDLKDYTYDTRAQLFVGLKRLEARIDGQVAELTARRAAMTSLDNPKDWDFAMKEMGNARSYFKSMCEELTKATPETWDQQKDKVGQAWTRAQDAYTKVKASVTT